jgi:tellurium resistance protein TerD
VAIQQRGGRRTFADIANPGVSIVEDFVELASEDFARVPGATAATFVEITRKSSGAWELHEVLSGFDGDLGSFTAVMGGRS